MRLFIALALPPGSADELDQLLTPLRPAWPGLRWTGRDAWHLTLAFLGEVDEKAAGNHAGRLERAATRHSPLSLSLSGAGAFPSQERARVLWTGIQGDRRGLTRLAASVAARARRAGVPLPQGGRKYQPHMTLARCRAPVDVRPLVETLAGYHGTPWVADEIHLIRSRLEAQPRYETLGAWRLRKRARGRRARGAGGPGAGRTGAAGTGAGGTGAGETGAAGAGVSPGPGKGQDPPKGLEQSA